MGDFNKEDKELESYQEFKALNLSSSNHRDTAPNIYELKPFYFKAFDNIFFSKGIKREKSGVKEGTSDHLLVWVDLKIK